MSDHDDDASDINDNTQPQQQQNIQPQIITTVSNNNAKFPYLKKDEYEKVIQNGNNLKRTGRDHDGRVIILPPTTADEHIAVQRESKARTTLLQSIPDDHVADFHYMDDARDIWNAVKARFGGNAESKKMRKSMLKQEFSEFRISESEGLHKGYDRMQKILSQLNQLKAKPDDEDINLKFLRGLPSSWSQVALTLKTKGGLELLSFDDLYYKLKTLEIDIKGYSTHSSSQSPSHSAFVSTTSTSKKMSYAESPSFSSSTTYSAPSSSKARSHSSGNVLQDVLHSLVAESEPEQQVAYEDFEQIDKLDFRINNFWIKGGKENVIKLNNINYIDMHSIQNPMIQTNQRIPTPGYPLVRVEVPLGMIQKGRKSENRRIDADRDGAEHWNKTQQNIRVISFTMKMEILLEPTSNKLMVEHVEFDESDTYVLERFYTSAGNPVKEILLKLNLPDHRSILTDSKEYLKMVMEVPDSS
ncbi:hypothetical protein Tco_0123466 [Tanacetum coccineum]